MSLFLCSKCGCVENTALSGYWWTVYQEKKPAVCSECGKDGKWHGQFEKRAPLPGEYAIGKDGHLYAPDDAYLRRVGIKHKDAAGPTTPEVSDER